jgi:hypothetical protein
LKDKVKKRPTDVEKGKEVLAEVQKVWKSNLAQLPHSRDKAAKAGKGGLAPH